MVWGAFKLVYSKWPFVYCDRHGWWGDELPKIYHDCFACRICGKIGPYFYKVWIGRVKDGEAEARNAGARY